MIISEVISLHYNQENVDRLHRLREAVNWQIVSERNDFLVNLEPIINGWHDQLPNLLDIFCPEEIELLLVDCMNNPSPSDEEVHLAELFVEFLARCGYHDPFYAVDEKNEPTSRRTTPLHLAARCTFYNRDTIIPLLFKIYNRFDMNYIDEESGHTHFHLACEYGCVDVVKNFLNCGQTPDCIVAGTNESLLHLAAKKSGNKKVIAMLVNKGADSRRPNNEGTTVMHLVCRYDDEEVLQIIYESDQRQLVEAINVKDNFGWTPLHTALFYDNHNVAKWLLKKGADSNSTNKDGETPLHVICKRRNDNSDAVKMLFQTCDNFGQVMQLEAKDNQGLTPLQEAVANLKPNTVAVLLNRGADLSSFVFPTEDHFTESFRVRRHEYDFKLQLAAGLLCVVEQLEKREYRLSRSNALVIMRLFAKNGLLIEKSADLEECWQDDEEFAKKLKEILVKPRLAIYDILQMRPEQEDKLLAYRDYVRLAHSRKLYGLPRKFGDACVTLLCEKLSRGFFRRWAVDSMLVSTGYQLPILCWEKIVSWECMNKDLCNICLAAESSKLQ